MTANTKTRQANGAAAKKTTSGRKAGQSDKNRAKEKLTADEQLLRAWRKSYENRHPA